MHAHVLPQTSGHDSALLDVCADMNSVLLISDGRLL